MKKLLSIFVSMAMALTSFGCVTYADNETTLVLQINNPMMSVNGEEAEVDPGFGTTPVISEGRTLVPVRAIVEAMGGNVDWNADNQTATLSYGDNEISLTVGSTTAELNHESRVIDTAPVIINNRTMLPIRFIAEGFGFDTDWDADSKTITITGESITSDGEHSVETRELHVDNNGKDIYGVLHIPTDIEGTMPLVIMSHGLGGTADSVTQYAEEVSKMGIAVYRYDFCGGGEDSRSDGETTEMSPLTEVTDLEAVIAASKTWDFVDSGNVFLMGNSQGGLVSALTSPDYQDYIKGEILLYPAFVSHDMVRETYSSLDEIPDTQWFNWLTLGRKYYEDMWDYDPYEQAVKYTGDVLLIHGDADEVVPISYSDRLSNELENVEYHIIPGAGHGFSGDDFTTAVSYIKDFLTKEINN